MTFLSRVVESQCHNVLALSVFFFVCSSVLESTNRLYIKVCFKDYFCVRFACPFF